MSGSAIGPTPAPTGARLTCSSANAFSNRARHAAVCGPKPTQPLQPGVAPSLATTLVVNYTRRCPDGSWSCCVTIVAFKFSALHFQGSPCTFLNSLITNLLLRCSPSSYHSSATMRKFCLLSDTIDDRWSSTRRLHDVDTCANEFET